MADDASRTGEAPGRTPRLGPLDLMFLRIETPSWPCHIGALAVVDGAALLDASGRLRLDGIAARLDPRLAGAPALRRRVHVPGPLQGGPLWVDDARFDIHRHVHAAAVEAPGGHPQLLDAAARLCERLLDRSRPLWDLWFLTGVSEGRVGVLLRLHHAVADGAAAVALMGSLFDEAHDATGPPTVTTVAAPVPARRRLLADNLATKGAAARRLAATLAHPGRVLRAARILAGVARPAFSHRRAPRTSLNPRVGRGRRVRFLRLDLGAVKEAAHARHGTVNDVVLGVWAGGLRRLLAARDEPVAHLEPVATVPASRRPAGATGGTDNVFGVMSVALPVWEPDPSRRLDLVVARTRDAKVAQNPAAVSGLLAALSATPLGRTFAARQRAANVEVTNVIGPPVTVHLLGAPVRAILPIVQPLGNLGPILCAFSYAGRLFLVVTADAGGNPDIDVLMAGMDADWRALDAGTRPSAGTGRERA
ncbi:MAG TPA: wax ester/triacylglycerol synthase family O-acyltransferase [Acidimicrobiales bacterium]